MSNPAARIIESSGGISATARALGHKNPSTVQGWKQRGLIPPRQWAAVQKAATKIGEKIEPSEFFPPASSRKARGMRGVLEIGAAAMAAAASMGRRALALPQPASQPKKSERLGPRHFSTYRAFRRNRWRNLRAFALRARKARAE